MYWLEVCVVTDGEAAEAIAEALRPLAYDHSVVFEQVGDENDLRPDALDPSVSVKIYLPGEQDTPAVRRRVEEILYFLGRLYPVPQPIFRKLEDTDWAHAWKEHYRPFRVGRRLLIQPSWTPPEENVGDQDIVLTLDPGMAFGTGLHPSTQMCLCALEDLIRSGMTVFDVGCGSGILSIAAAKLGAARVLAVDTDSQAVAATRANAIQNDVSQLIDVEKGSLSVAAKTRWDLIIVNILAPVIISMLCDGELLDCLAPSGTVVLGGIIEGQLPDVESALAVVGGEVAAVRKLRDWVTLVVRLK